MTGQAGSGRPHVLCPIDFSEPSRSALGYAVAIADHFGASLDVLAVDDPLLAGAAAQGGEPLEAETRRELQRFCAPVLQRAHPAHTASFRVRTGKPATEILAIAHETTPDLIVMGSHGRSGFGRLFFGSTTERVLRETPVPVLVTPDDHLPPRSLSEIAAGVDKILAPVDLSPASSHQCDVACGIASALSASLVVAHVVETPFIPPALRSASVAIEAERRVAADNALARLVTGAKGCRAEPVVVDGQPAEEIVKLAETLGVGLIVISLHSDGPRGERMGSVTYRVLCLTKRLVLALPPGTGKG